MHLTSSELYSNVNAWTSRTLLALGYSAMAYGGFVEFSASPNLDVAKGVAIVAGGAATAWTAFSHSEELFNTREQLAEQEADAQKLEAFRQRHPNLTQ